MKCSPQALGGMILILILGGAAVREAPPGKAPERHAGESAIALSSVMSQEENEEAAAAEREVMGNEPLPDLKMNAGIAELMDSGETLYALRPGGRWPLASLTKIMTAVIALENLPAEGERDNLIRRMMVISDNGAAETLADRLGIAAWVDLMNAKAAELRMDDTGFADASGLSYLNQSTAYDVRKLVAYAALRHPEIFAWSRLPSVKAGDAAYANINDFAGRADWLGGKTGFTDEANGNLVSIFRTDRGPLMLIVLGAGGKAERFAETEKLLAWLQRHFRLYGY